MYKRSALEGRRDRLALACTALSKIQVHVHVSQPASLSAGIRNASTSGGGYIATGSSSSSSSSSSGSGSGIERTRLTLTVQIGSNGIGLVVTDDESSNHIMIKDLRKMPDNSPNPSEIAGVRVGDEVERINGEAPSNLQDAVNMLKNSRHSVTLTILRSS